MTEAAELVTVSVAARRLGVSEITVRKWCNQGNLPCVTTSLGRLIDPADVERLVEERKA